MPREFEVFARTWEKWHPDWTFTLWTESTLPPLVNRWAYEHSRSMTGKANIVRYEILLRFGGIYIDTDFECLRSLEPLVQDVECFIAQERDIPFEHGRVATMNNAIIGAVPDHPFLRDLVERLDPHMRALTGTVGSGVESGPHYLTDVIQEHPEVQVFAKELFYPYEFHERWRRDDTFPDAYAVHHWTLSGITTALRRAEVRHHGVVPALSVILAPTAHDDGLRFRWVLEGLCRQTMEDFEVLVTVPAEEERLAAMCGEYDQRLTLTCTRATSLPDTCARARAARTLVLDDESVPDEDVTQRHAAVGDRDLVFYSFRRVYPRSKFFPFRDTIDYKSLRRHSLPERDFYVTPWHVDEDLPASCFSAPTARLRALAAQTADAPVRTRVDLLRRIVALGCKPKASVMGGHVTWMGPEDRDAGLDVA